VRRHRSALLRGRCMSRRRLLPRRRRCAPDDLRRTRRRVLQQRRDVQRGHVLSLRRLRSTLLQLLPLLQQRLRHHGLPVGLDYLRLARR
jgi:hypothetical protein